jgi:hypothetical protein
MAYGIEVFSSNSSLQFGTTAQESLSVINSGTVGATNSVTYDGANEILCFNRSTTGWIDGNTNSTATSWTGGATINWIKLKRITTDSSNPAGDDSGDYGIQVFNSAGNATTYSSNFTKGPEVLAVKSPGSVTSGGTAVSSAGIIYSGAPAGVYVGVGRMVWGYDNWVYQAYETLYFDYTNNVIRSRNLSGYNIGYGFIYVGHPNKSSMIIFKRKG